MLYCRSNILLILDRALSRMIPHFVKNLQSFLQSYNKSLINQACSGPYLENIGPRSFLYGPRCARSVLSRPRADILPVRPSRLGYKIYVATKIFKLSKVFIHASVSCFASSKLPMIKRTEQVSRRIQIKS